MGRTVGPAMTAPTTQDTTLRNRSKQITTGSNHVAALHGISTSSKLSPVAREVLLNSLPRPLAKAIQPTLDFKPIITRTQLRTLIASTPQIPFSPSRNAARSGGGVLILFNRLILNPSDFLPSHPGGELAFLHFVGRDAQDEIEAYHSDAALKQMASWVVGVLDEDDWMGRSSSDGHGSTTKEELERGGYVPLVPPIQLGYRAGVLEAPHAQAAAFSHHLTPSRPQSFPLPPDMLEPPPPPANEVEPARERKMSQAYRELHRRIAGDGWYVLRPAGYARECARYSLLGSLAFYLFYKGTSQQDQSPFLLFLSSTCLGLLWHQLTFTAHDAGHHGITHSPLVDRLIGVVIADLIGGLSIGWWCDNHDVHHLVTNHPEHDPDIQHMPFFAISPRFVAPEPEHDAESGSVDGQQGKQRAETLAPEGLWSTYYRRVLTFDAPARVFLKYQHQLYYIVMSLGRFNLYANSYGFLAKRAWRLAMPGKNGGALGGGGSEDGAVGGEDVRVGLDEADAATVSKILRPRAVRAGGKKSASSGGRDGKKLFHLIVEVSCLVVFWTWFGAGVLGSIRGWGWKVMYVLVSHIVTSPLHVQIVLSHFAQCSADLGLYESFPSRQLRTTMDVLCPPWLDFLHGGLHMQVTHHLFPRIPRHNLRAVRDKYVRAFADSWGETHPRSSSSSASSTQENSTKKRSLYSEFTFGEGNRRVLGVLAEVARQVKVLGEVAEAQAKGTLHHQQQQSASSEAEKYRASGRAGAESSSGSGTESD
ncbi:hypothetical protein A4X09_0g3709 [Tilletia walkeri]|uniref:Delta 8-(E)-sphingolipid desaturase n=1 Tax=Tilletia walkeri TaxID=117179 RepID=A0A8X7N9V8_9BASI|nr:hypothetical protein A4X09_0g3709 [Tilletia walkeri]